MPEPSLGELAGAGQSMEAVPTISVNNGQEMVRTLNQQAQFKAQNDWNKYQSFLKQKADTLQNLAEIQKQDVMTEDRPELQQDAAEMYRKILANPGMFMGKDNSAYDEVQAMYGGLLEKTTESKQNNYFDKENRKYVATNNELNTDDNKGIIDSFRSQPLGSRKAYNLNLPTVLDIDAYSKGIMDSPSVKTDYATSEVTPDNQFMIEKTGTKYDRGNFMNRWMGGLNVKTDKYGHSISGYVQQQYNKLPEEVKQNIPGKTPDEKVKNFWKVQGEKMFGSNEDIISDKKETRKDNTNFMKPEKFAQDERELNEKIRHDKAMEGLGWERVKSGNKEDDDQAQGSIIEIGDVIENATRPENIKFVVDPNGNRQQYGTFSDPDLLKKYATLDKTGKTTKPADEVFVDRTSGQLLLGYYKRNKKGEIDRLPDKVTGDTKVPGAAKLEKTVPVNTSSWVSAVVGRNEGVKNKGKVITTVQKFYDKLGGVYQGARKLNQAQGNGVAPETKGATGEKTYIVNGEAYTAKELGWTPDQIKSALGSGKIKEK